MTEYPQTILKVIVGSQMWGTATPESDIDYKVVTLASVRDVLSPFTTHDKAVQKVAGQEDTATYEVSHFVRLALKGNPTIMEVLYSPLVEEQTLNGKILRSQRAHMLNSRSVYEAAAGMARSQLSRAERDIEAGRSDTKIGKLYASTILSVALARWLLLSQGLHGSIEPQELKVNIDNLIDFKQGKFISYAQHEAFDALKHLDATYDAVTPFYPNVRTVDYVVREMYARQLYGKGQGFLV